MYYSLKRLNKKITINNIYINLRKRRLLPSFKKSNLHVQYICISQHIS